MGLAGPVRALSLLALLLAVPGAALAEGAAFGGQAASPSARRAADWVVASADNHGLPFVVVDKASAQVFVLDARGQLRGASPALLGLARGDRSVPGIGERKLSAIKPGERTTPAGRFVAELGNDLGDDDILWVDYDNAISLHRVITGTPRDQRLKRLASPTAADNRITYGCINVPVAFYEGVVKPMFTAAGGIVYVLPEVERIEAVFPGM